MRNTNLDHELTRLHADYCFALADTRRLLLIYALSERDSNVGELVKACGFSQPSVSRNLKILRERGLVKAKRRGSTVEYRLTDKRLIEALDILREIMRSQWVRRAEIVALEEA